MASPSPTPSAQTETASPRQLGEFVNSQPMVVDGMGVTEQVDPSLTNSVYEYAVRREQQDRKTRIVQEAFKKLPELELPLEAADPDDFFMKFEDIAAHFQVGKLEWFSWVGRKLGSQLRSELSPTLTTYEVVKDAVCRRWGYDDPLTEYEDQLVALRCTSAATAAREFALILRKYEASLDRLVRSKGGITDESSFSQRRQVRWFVRALPAELASEINGYLQLRAFDGLPLPSMAKMYEIAEKQERTMQKRSSSSLGSPAVLAVAPKAACEVKKPQRKGLGKARRSGLVYKTGRSTKCFVCDKEGHRANTCPLKAQWKASSKGTVVQKTTRVQNVGATYIEVYIGSLAVPAVVDSGSPISLVHVSLVSRLHRSQSVWIEENEVAEQAFVAADGRSFTVNTVVTMPINFGSRKVVLKFFLSHVLPALLIFGVDTLVELHADLNFNKQLFICNINKQQVTVPISVDRKDMLRAGDFVIIPARHEGFIPLLSISEDVYVEETHPQLVKDGCFIARVKGQWVNKLLLGRDGVHGGEKHRRKEPVKKAIGGRRTCDHLA
jgi:hypothetical protein